MSEEIRKKINESAEYYAYHHPSNDFKAGAEYGYSLAQEEFKQSKQRQREILNDLINDQPNQDELWEEIAQSIITHVQVMPELKSKLTIKRN